MRRISFEPNDEYLRELGRITVRFADLELFVGRMVAFMLGPDINRGDLVMARQSFRQKLDTLGALTHYRTDDEEVRRATGAAIKRADCVGEERNKCVHSQWHLDIGAQDATRSKPSANRKRGYEHKFEPVPLSDLENTSDEIADVMQEFALLWQMMAFKDLLPAVTVSGNEAEDTSD